MTVARDHTIVRAHDRHETARHLVELLGPAEPTVDGGRALCWNDPDGHNLEIPHPSRRSTVR